MGYEYAYRTRTKTVDKIIVHHTGGGSLSGALSTLQDRGLSYNVIIDKDGTPTTLVPFSRVAFHAGNSNDTSIGISLVGDFTKTQPTGAQLATLANVIRDAVKQYPTITAVLRHKDVASTDCPGNLDITSFKSIPTESKQPSNHWAQEHFDYLNAHGLTIHEKRFDEPITRGELFAVIAQLIKK